MTCCRSTSLANLKAGAWKGGRRGQGEKGGGGRKMLTCCRSNMPGNIKVGALFNACANVTCAYPLAHVRF